MLPSLRPLMLNFVQLSIWFPFLKELQLWYKKAPNVTLLMLVS